MALSVPTLRDYSGPDVNLDIFGSLMAGEDRRQKKKTEGLKDVYQELLNQAVPAKLAIEKAEEARKAAEDKRLLDFLDEINGGAPGYPQMPAVPAPTPAAKQPSPQELKGLELDNELGLGASPAPAAPSPLTTAAPSTPMTPGKPVTLPDQTVSPDLDAEILMGQALDKQPPLPRPQMTDQEIRNAAMRHGQFDVANQLAPLKTLEGQQELIEARGAQQDEVLKAKNDFAMTLQAFKEGRADWRAVLQANSAMDRARIMAGAKPKSESGLPIRGLESGQADKIGNIFRTSGLLSRINDAANNISSLKRGPIAGRVSGVDPYAADIQALEKLVNQTIPSMARGVFGEVGVLTDQDVDRYKAMFANIKNDPTVASKLMADLKQTIQDAYEALLTTYDYANYDVSRYPRGISFEEIAKIGGAKTPEAAGGAQGTAPKKGDTKKSASGKILTFDGKEWVR